MVLMSSLNQYLVCRNGRWHYFRKVPVAYRTLDSRSHSKCSLKTTSLEVARLRRDAMVEADDLYWTSLVQHDAKDQTPTANPARERYRSAKTRALARGFIYTPVTELVDVAGLEEILNRLSEIQRHPRTEKAEAEALLGTVETAAPPISEAFEIYCEHIAKTEIRGKSDEQKASWKKVKNRAVQNFVAVCGDLEMDKIDRKTAQNFRKWWADRLTADDPKKVRNPNSANKDIGNLRTLFEAYWNYEGEPDRQNPFDKLRFGNVEYKKILPFSDEFVRSKILRPGVFDGLNNEAALIVFALIETGCRPSEIANLLEDHIVLDHEIPHIKIRGTSNRQLKSKSSVREIPLLGVSLEAMKRAQKGFPRYRNKGALLSASLLKAFKSRNLLPTDQYRIYSFRHSFEKRMLEANLDYGLRCLLMGHHNKRPQYGDGGSLEFRCDQLMKIVHPYPKDMFSG